MNVLKFVRLIPLAAVLACAGLMLTPNAAQARGHFGVFIGPSIVVGAPGFGYYYPYAYPPPVYYAPAPTYYYPAPAYTYPAAPAPAGYTCYAGPYVCPLSHVQPVGGPCACPAYGGGGMAGSVR